MSTERAQGTVPEVPVLRSILSLVDLQVHHNYVKSCAVCPSGTTSDVSLMHINIKRPLEDGRK